MTTVSQHQKDIIRNLKDLIGPYGWCISGSFANKKIQYPSDIDIYFISERCYQAATKKIQANSNWALDRESTSADTYCHLSPFANTPVIPLPLQFVKKHFGNISYIFSTMDLNVCKKAIFPDYTYVEDRNAQLPLHITRKHANTYTRIEKYITNLSMDPEEYLPILRQIIDENIDDSTMLSGYYDESFAPIDIPNNKAMHKSFKKMLGVQDYLQEKALKHAPELLI